MQSKTDLHGATPFTKEDWRLCLERAGIATCFHMPDEAAFFGDTEHGRSTAFSVMAVKKHTVGRAKPLPQRLLPGRTRPRDPGCRDGHWAFVATPGWADDSSDPALFECACQLKSTCTVYSLHQVECWPLNLHDVRRLAGGKRGGGRCES